ncbi:hypothetical protein FEFB_05710 [Fructobacillus sp. EFB-N1]|uniref:hypothetical protein n=1 Tax=Fructobacillus sp. EFB-N1 TaxID=1658766 RepID=UPI00064D7B55|nr:hypothetical protein [Fructobacillus sp. EFB-N1]KMK53629.1 hypothetical protein FEFB_05640 [Fructobacillus sp. EFB-N1]KMK53636.1 hypothetical protein FEFB_05710 [Fructobacillus sp. EFB-N1]
MTDQKYQLEYDKVLIVNPAIKLDNGEWLSDLSLNMRLSPIFDMKEIDEHEAQFKLPPSVVKVGYDQKSKSFTFDKQPDFDGDFEISGYQKGIVASKESRWVDQKMTSKKEFDALITKYGLSIDSDSSLQSCAYSIHYLDSERK